MKRLLVGGPLLGQDLLTNNVLTSEGKAAAPRPFWSIFDPIISDPIVILNDGSQSNSKAERFVLLPNRDFVAVLAYKTGKRIATLLPQKCDSPMGEDSLFCIESTTLATFPIRNSASVEDLLKKASEKVKGHGSAESRTERDHVLLIGCSDGTIQEFDLAGLLLQNNNQSRPGSSINGQLEFPGRCEKPRRVFRVAQKDHSIKHMTSVPLGPAFHSVVLYALATSIPTEMEVDEDVCTDPQIHGKLLRIAIPPVSTNIYDTDSVTKVVDLSQPDENDLQRIETKDDKLEFSSYLIPKKEITAAPFPFRLVATAVPEFEEDGDQLLMPMETSAPSQIDVVVILANSKSLRFYCERLDAKSMLSSSDRQALLQPVEYAFLDHYRSDVLLASVSIAPNGKDIACGHFSGMVRILIKALPTVVQYCKDRRHHLASIERSNEKNGGADSGPVDIKEPKHPHDTVLTRKLHWHARPVASMVYDFSIASSEANEGMLYTGGDESVLITWKLNQGGSKPSDILPRIALGGILRLTCSASFHSSTVEEYSDHAILVYCADNSLQLFDARNRNLKWKTQGLALGRADAIIPSLNTSMILSPKSITASSQDFLVVSGLPKAPGHMHWYDPRDQKVVKSMEVVPFNRVSRTGYKDSALPAPSVTHACWSKSGKDMITVDMAPTENSTIGSQESLRDGKKYGIVSTVRFWSLHATKAAKASTYDLAAAMAYPHGSSNRVSAAAIAPDGNLACTVSNDENAFRLWRRDIIEEIEADRGLSKRPGWFCRCKVSTPAGYSNFPTGRSAVTFSNDGSVIAISFGNMITLWDYHQVTLLTSICHGNMKSGSVVDSVQFLQSDRCADILLTKCSSSVVMQSPYGKLGPTNLGWMWKISNSEKSARVSIAEFIPSHNLVAIALFNTETNKSRIVIVDALTGEIPKAHKEEAVVDNLPGELVSLAASRNDDSQTQWVENNSTESFSRGPFCIYALTESGQMIALHSKESGFDVSLAQETNTENFDLPPVPLFASVKQSSEKKRSLAILDVTELQEAPKKKLAMHYFKSMDGETEHSSSVPSSELPQLCGSFTRSYVTRFL